MNRILPKLMDGGQVSPWRMDFPMLSAIMNGQRLAFLDSAASAQKPYPVIAAMTAVMETKYSNIHRGLYSISQKLTEQCEDVRGKVAAFIGAPIPETIIFTKNATEAINLVAHAWGDAFLGPGDEIVLTAMEHHANIVPWQIMAGKKGCVIKAIPVTEDGQLDLSVLPRLLTERTKIVAFTHVSNVLGTINPVKEIIETVKQHNPAIRVLVDGSQGVVHAPVDVAHLNCDFYAFTGHKLYGPTGIGVLYGKADVLAEMPPWQGGGDMIDRVAFTGTTFRDPPHRFEAGTPAIIEIIGLGAAIDYLNRIGRAAVLRHEEVLTQEMRVALMNFPGIKLYGPVGERAGIFAFTANWAHPGDLAMVLDRCGVAVRTGHHCAMPLHEVLGVQGSVRASFGLYSDSTDIGALMRALEKAQRILT